MREALDVGAQIADALDAAHKHGIVHRDLKPRNVMLTKTGVKLLDFGLAKLHPHEEGVSVASRGTVAEPLTERGAILGTVPYMAPEQLEGREADARSDLWALGAILYEMVTADGPSRHEPGEPNRRDHVGGPCADLDAATAGTTALARVVRKCLAKAPDDRWDGAHDVGDELRWITQSSGTASAPARFLAPRGGRTASALGTARRGGSPRGGGRRGRLAAGARRRGAVGSRRALAGARLAGRGTQRRGVSPATFRTRAGRGRRSRGRPTGRRSSSWVAVAACSSCSCAPSIVTRRAHSPTRTGADPTVSSDGQAVVFWAAGAIRKVPLAGGAVAAVVEHVAVPPTSLAWNARGQLLYDQEGRIQLADGGRPAAR